MLSEILWNSISYFDYGEEYYHGMLNGIFTSRGYVPAYIYALNLYAVVKEMTAVKGFADVVYIPYKTDRPAMIVELKRNKCAESAISQTQDRQYFQSPSHYRGNLFVGIDYDEEEKTHECRITKFVV